jgi:hypothetical protein
LPRRMKSRNPLSIFDFSLRSEILPRSYYMARHGVARR